MQALYLLRVDAHLLALVPQANPTTRSGVDLGDPHLRAVELSAALCEKLNECQLAFHQRRAKVADGCASSSRRSERVLERRSERAR